MAHLDTLLITVQTSIIARLMDGLKACPLWTRVIVELTLRRNEDESLERPFRDRTVCSCSHVHIYLPFADVVVGDAWRDNLLRTVFFLLSNWVHHPGEQVFNKTDRFLFSGSCRCSLWAILVQHDTANSVLDFIGWAKGKWRSEQKASSKFPNATFFSSSTELTFDPLIPHPFAFWSDPNTNVDYLVGHHNIKALKALSSRNGVSFGISCDYNIITG